MKNVKELIEEYEIRFRDTDRFIGAPDNTKHAILIKDNSIWNKYGVVYENGIWQIADIKVLPDKWVSEIDFSNNLLWDVFWSNCDYDNGKFPNLPLMSVFNTYYSNTGVAGNSLLDFKGHQYLTLEQCNELYDKMRNRWGIFYDNDTLIDEINLIMKGNINILKLKSKFKDKYIDEYGSDWNNFFEIDIHNPTTNEINKFLAFVKSDYKLK